MSDAPIIKLKQIKSKSDEIPSYMENITLKELHAYYFNWNTHQKTATLEEVKIWFKDIKGWDWEEQL